MRVSPGVVPRLEFFVVDSTGAPVPSLVRTDFSAFAYSLITDGLYSSAVTVTPSSNVAATAAKSAGQFVTINSAKGHYAVDCPSGAASSVATHVEMSATPNTGTYVVYPVRSDIETKISTLFESVSGSTAPTVERSPTDTKVITFAWPVSGATITATVSKDNGSYAATIGTVSFLRTESGKHFYSLSYNVSDRPTSEGTARYKFVDGTYTRYVNLRVAVAGGGDGEADWTSTEREQIRYRLGLNGTATAPTDPTPDPIVVTPGTGNTTTGYYTVLDKDLDPEPGVTVYAKMLDAYDTDTGFIYSGDLLTSVSNAYGVCQFTMIKGASYRCWRNTPTPTAPISLIVVPLDAGTTTPLKSMVRI